MAEVRPFGPRNGPSLNLPPAAIRSQFITPPKRRYINLASPQQNNCDK